MALKKNSVDDKSWRFKWALVDRPASKRWKKVKKQPHNDVRPVQEEQRFLWRQQVLFGSTGFLLAVWQHLWSVNMVGFYSAIYQYMNMGIQYSIIWILWGISDQLCDQLPSFTSLYEYNDRYWYTNMTIYTFTSLCSDRLQDMDHLNISMCKIWKSSSSDLTFNPGKLKKMTIIAAETSHKIWKKDYKKIWK